MFAFLTCNWSKLRRAWACAACAGVSIAHAQVSGSVAVVSDYRFRGVSLSDGAPAAQATWSYDHASGAYAGAFASSVKFAADGRSGVQALGYAGHSARLAGSLSWDVGAAYADFTMPRGYAYDEYHVGLANTDWSARAFYTPHYLGRAFSAAYAELNLTPASERELAPMLHIGVLHASVPPYLGPRTRWDARVALAYNYEALTLQLSWNSASRGGGFARGGQDKSAWVLRLTRWL